MKSLRISALQEEFDLSDPTRTMKSPDGDRYMGQTDQDKIPNGLGSYEWPDGRHYAGYWYDGERHGRGKEVLPDGRMYVGDFVRGVFHGQGVETMPDGSSYDGGKCMSYVALLASFTCTVFHYHHRFLLSMGQW